MPRGFKSDGTPIRPQRPKSFGHAQCEWCGVSFVKMGPRQRCCTEHKMVAWRNCALVAKFGVTVYELRDMHQRQNGLCGICTEPIPFDPTIPSKKGAGTGRSRGLMPDTDHCHVTGKVRGLLCHNCNSRLGTLEDREWIMKAEAYLVRSMNSESSS